VKPAPFTYHLAHDVAEAVALLTELGEDAKVLAGGQSLVPMMNLRLARPSALVDITRIPGLSYLRAGPDGLRIGALTRHRAVETTRDPAVLAGFGVLPRSARWIGHYPIRARGTFGGSIAHADSTSEWCLLAVLLRAEITLAGPAGQRRVGAGDFFQGFFTTAAEPDEMVTEVRFPHPSRHAALTEFAPRLRRPVRWVEDRQENLTASFHGHEQRYQVRAAFAPDGRMLGLAAEIDCDVGAYSAFPFTSAVEPLMACTELPGVYKVPAYSARGRAVATNKAPTAPYRGVSRPQLVLVMERLMEKAARELGLGPLEVRRANLIGPGEFPYTGLNAVTYDEGSYRESLDLAERRVAEAGWPQEKITICNAGRLGGIGYACFSERTAYGTPTMSQRRMGMTPGYDTALVRMDPSGEVIVTTGTCGHGQGHETTFAQIVADRLGVHPDRVRLRQGDTDLASYGWGTWGSRSIVIGGGAAARAAERVGRQLRQVAAHLLEASAADIELSGGSARVRGDPGSALPVGELARVVHFQAHRLPEELRYGLEARATFDPPGTFSNACHVAMVAIDPGTGQIRLCRYLVVEDCGVVINPMVVDGQVRGGVAQGAGAALLERVRYDGDGQPGSGTLMDYLAPTAAEICPVDIVHLQTPSRFSETGAKGMGEGGTIGAPAAVLNAVNDALRPAGVSFDHIPVLPADVCAALAQRAVI
jgi:aerobic carbon-monoxide dehydrogenase large subunit